MTTLHRTLFVIFASLVSVPGLGVADDQLRPCCCCERKVCRVTVERTETDETGFDCECIDVCIPPVRFWWECGPIRRCGKVRTVAKLTTDKVKRETWTYQWNALTICDDCYRDVHQLRCDELGLSPDTPAELVGLPVEVPAVEVDFRAP